METLKKMLDNAMVVIAIAMVVDIAVSVICESKNDYESMQVISTIFISMLIGLAIMSIVKCIVILIIKFGKK